MSDRPSGYHPVHFRDFILLFSAISILFLIGLGAAHYGVPSESRYIEIPRQMVETGDWLTPRINGVKYFEKPPLFYWVQAAQIQWFGLGEFSGRLWTALGMVFLSLTTFVAATKKYGRRVGILSALILASSALGFMSSRIVLLDVPVSLFLSIALFAFMFASEMPASRKRDGVLLLMYVASALAVMTKGLIGIVIPAMVIGSWILLTNRWEILLRVRLISGLLLFLLITAPWHYLAGQVTPEFYHFYFIHEHFERFLTKTHGRYQPPWYFLVMLPATFLPWTVFLWQAISARLKTAWHERKGEGSDLYLLLWLGLPLVFFSLSDSKLIPYILPLFPVLAILVARHLDAQWVDVWNTGYKRGAYAMAGVYLLLALAVPVALLVDGAYAEVIAPVLVGAVLCAVLFFAFAVLIGVMVRKRVLPSTVVKVLAVSAILLIPSLGNMMSHANLRSSQDSTKAFAEYLKPRLEEGDEVAVLNHYFQDFPVYLGRNVTVVNDYGELTFGRSIEPITRQWMVNSRTFLHRWRKADHRIYLLLRRDAYISYCKSYCAYSRVVFDDGGRNILIENTPESDS